MNLRKDTKKKSNCSNSTIGLASPEEILENSYVERVEATFHEPFL